jgi:DNA repair exonuclease SbcCD ATPase subunit
MLTATLTVLIALLLIGVLLLVVDARRRARASTPAQSAPPRPNLGSPAQVWLERAERITRSLRELAERYPALYGAADDADAVLAELRSAATDVARLDEARSRLPTAALQARRERLDASIAAAANEPAAAELRSARAAVDAQLELATQHRATRDRLLARMQAAVAGLEQADAELHALAAQPSDVPQTATVALADRLAGLRAGLAEVRAISDQLGHPDQGHPRDLPGSVERPPRT